MPAKGDRSMAMTPGPPARRQPRRRLDERRSGARAAVARPRPPGRLGAAAAAGLPGVRLPLRRHLQGRRPHASSTATRRPASTRRSSRSAGASPIGSLLGPVQSHSFAFGLLMSIAEIAVGLGLAARPVHPHRRPRRHGAVAVALADRQLGRHALVHRRRHRLPVRAHPAADRRLRRRLQPRRLAGRRPRAATRASARTAPAGSCSAAPPRSACWCCSASPRSPAARQRASGRPTRRRPTPADRRPAPATRPAASGAGQRGGRPAGPIWSPRPRSRSAGQSRSKTRKPAIRPGCCSSRPGQFTAYSAVCPHQQCTVGFVSAKDGFACPCHGSRFAADGKLLQGPATRGLTAIPVTVADGAVRRA